MTVERGVQISFKLLILFIFITNKKLNTQGTSFGASKVSHVSLGVHFLNTDLK